MARNEETIFFIYYNIKSWPQNGSLQQIYPIKIIIFANHIIYFNIFYIMIQVMLKAMDIVELLSTSPQKEFSLAEIADSFKMDHGTCSNIMKTLLSRGYVQQSAPRRGYKFGYMFYKLCDSAVLNEDLTKIAREDVEKLGKRLNESVILSVIKNDKRIVLYHTTPDREVIVRTNIDKSVYSTNTGRVILANYTPDHLDRFIIRVGLPSDNEWPEVRSSQKPESELRERLARIRRDGFDIYSDESLSGFAAPLFRSGHVVASLGVYLPSYRLEGNNEAILSAVLETSAEINRKLTLTGNCQ